MISIRVSIAVPTLACGAAVGVIDGNGLSDSGTDCGLSMGACVQLNTLRLTAASREWAIDLRAEGVVINFPNQERFPGYLVCWSGLPARCRRY